MITIICAGSRGDFQPYIALAQAIQKMHQPVRMVGSYKVEALVRSYGIEYVPIDDNFEKLGVDPKVIKAAQSADQPLKMLMTFNKMKKYGILIAEETYQALQDSELIIYHPGCTIGYFVAQKMKIPAILASPFPLHRTKDFLSLILYGRVKPTAFQIKMSYIMLQKMLWMASSSSVKQYWKQTFHHLPQNFGCPYERMNDHHPAIISCSNHVFARPNDWNEAIHQAGYWFVEETNYQPSIELQTFLAHEERPIYIGFGSVFHEDEKEELWNLILDALQQCGKRAIISGMGTFAQVPDTIMVVDAIPHTWLFPQVSLVCHHGGAGTSAAGFQAGIPSVIIPFSNDQFAWAHRAYDIGVAAKPLYRKKLSATALAQAIEAALQPEIIAQAKHLGAQIAKEDGARTCAKVVVELKNSMS